MGLAFSRSLAQSCADRRLATSAARHRALEPRARRVRSAPRSSGWFGCGAAQLGSVRMPHGSGPFGCRAAQLGFVRRLSRQPSRTAQLVAICGSFPRSPHPWIPARPGFVRVPAPLWFVRLRHMFPFLARRPRRPLGRHARARRVCRRLASRAIIQFLQVSGSFGALPRRVVRLRHTLFRAVRDSALV
jgi:hypothetical protein